jgi:hypothetical protein
MTNERITRASDVLSVWPVFEAGFQHLAKQKELHYNELQAKKLLCKVATDAESGYVSVVFSDEGDPLAFIVLQENTLPFSTFRTFTVRAVYYRPGHADALLILLGGFEQWATHNGVRRYTLPTRRPVHVAKRVFAGEKYGFTRMSLNFEKTL